MDRSDNDRSIKGQEYNNTNSTVNIYITDNRLQYGMYRLVEVNVKPLIYNAL